MHENYQYAPETDAAIRRIEDDKLRRAEFALQVAKAIRNISHSEGYVIGLTGEWGSGKSSVVNLIKDQLTRLAEVEPKERAQDPYVWEFKPWLYSGHHDLIGAFFIELRTALQKAAEKKQLLANEARENAQAQAELILGVGSLAAALAPNWGGDETQGRMASSSKTSIFASSANQRQTLQVQHEAVTRSLELISRKILVIIDDIDRLDADEIRDIFTLVKTVGQLPNVVYLLCYDKAIVDSAFVGKAGDVGRRYAEKIVQQELNVPDVEPDDLLRLLYERVTINETTHDPDTTIVIEAGVSALIRTPRDAQRLANAYSFTELRIDNEMPELHILVMEAIRLFEPQLFEWIRSKRSYLVLEENVEDTFQRRRAELRGRIGEERETALSEALFCLFPTIGPAEKRVSAVANAVRVRGIGSPYGYDRYFRFFGSPDRLSLREAKPYIDALGDVSALDKALGPLIHSASAVDVTKFARIVDEFTYRRQDGVDPSIELAKWITLNAEGIAALRHNPECESAISELFWQWFGALALAPAEAERQVYNLGELSDVTFACELYQFFENATNSRDKVHADFVENSKVVRSLLSKVLSIRLKEVLDSAGVGSWYNPGIILRTMDSIFRGEPEHEQFRPWAFRYLCLNLSALLSIVNQEVNEGKDDQIRLGLLSPYGVRPAREDEIFNFHLNSTTTSQRDRNALERGRAHGLFLTEEFKKNLRL